MKPLPGIVVSFNDIHSFIAHETGHMLGLNHSFGPREFRCSGVAGEYGDPWCVMSADYFGGRAVDIDPQIAGFGLGLYTKGPGLNGGTRIFRNWAEKVDLILQPGLRWRGTLKSLNSAPNAGLKVVCIHIGDDSYTIEFRSPADLCDRGLACPTALIHQQAGSSADRTYPRRGCATLRYEISRGRPRYSRKHRRFPSTVRRNESGWQRDTFISLRGNATVRTLVSNLSSKEVQRAFSGRSCVSP